MSITDSEGHAEHCANFRLRRNQNPSLGIILLELAVLPFRTRLEKRLEYQ